MTRAVLAVDASGEVRNGARTPGRLAGLMKTSASSRFGLAAS